MNFHQPRYQAVDPLPLSQLHDPTFTAQRKSALSRRTLHSATTISRRCGEYLTAPSMGHLYSFLATSTQPVKISGFTCPGLTLSLPSALPNALSLLPHCTHRLYSNTSRELINPLCSRSRTSLLFSCRINLFSSQPSPPSK